MNRIALTVASLILVAIGAEAQGSTNNCKQTRPPCDKSCKETFDTLKDHVRNAEKLLVLVRHAAKGSWTARDCKDNKKALTSGGIIQAEKLAKLFDSLNIAPHVVYASPACRTLETAERAFPKAKVKRDNNLLYGHCDLTVKGDRVEKRTVVYVTHSDCLGKPPLKLKYASDPKNYGVVAFFERQSDPNGLTLMGCMWP